MITDTNLLNISFWGTRGSYPSIGKDFLQYGGHTSCISCEIDNQLIIFDAGSGMVSLSKDLANKSYKVIHLFLTHFHLDHLIGFPFFSQNRDSNFTINIYCGNLQHFGGIEYNLKSFIQPPLFPFTLADFKANLKFNDIDPGFSTNITQNLKIQTIKLNHPNGSIGYKLSFQDKSFCYITDTEYQSETIDQEFLDFINNTKLVIFDTSYTDEEYPKFAGWGHSTWQEAIRICQRVNVESLAFYHHSPNHTDEKLNQINQLALKQWDQIITAYDGLKLQI